MVLDRLFFLHLQHRDRTALHASYLLPNVPHLDELSLINHCHICPECHQPNAGVHRLFLLVDASEETPEHRFFLGLFHNERQYSIVNVLVVEQSFNTPDRGEAQRHTVEELHAVRHGLILLVLERRREDLFRQESHHFIHLLYGIFREVDRMGKEEEAGEVGL